MPGDACQQHSLISVCTARGMHCTILQDHHQQPSRQQHDILVVSPFLHPADSSKQSSRSPSTLLCAVARPTSTTSIYQDALGHSHLPHRTHTQEVKQDRTGDTQHTQHHPRSDSHSGEHEEIGWKMYCTASFTTALSMVMAELVRQVEVHCSERAHALALGWNLYSAAMDTCQSRKHDLTRLLLRYVSLHFGLTADTSACHHGLWTKQYICSPSHLMALT